MPAMPDVAATPTLPDGWEAILDNITARLQEAVAALDARMALVPAAPDVTASATRRTELAALAVGAEQLAAEAARAEDTDAALAASEEFLRWRLAEAESLRERVAGWRNSIG
jgi:hypothetical protein